jgi:parallel beta-helix repeat protein
MFMRSWIRNLFARQTRGPIRKSPHRRCPAVEVLEERCAPAALARALDGGNLAALDQANSIGRASLTHLGPNDLTRSSAQAVPGVVPVEVMGPEGKLVPLFTPGPTGYTPQQLQTAYGLNQVNFAGIKGDGAGQTIALVDAYDNPSFVNSTDPNFNTSALHIFDQTFGLPDPPSFTKVNQNGQAAPLAQPSAINGWSTEIALDIEWSHAMAPAASIILVEANSQGGDLFTAAATAGKLATVVSMSWGGSEFSEESNLDSPYEVPGVTYLAGTGDHGAPGSYPAYSPHVVAVGGTSLSNLDANGDYPGTGTNGEVGWSQGSNDFDPTLASGGGISQYETEPSYQTAVQSTGQRTIPDISAMADASTTGVAYYDPYDYGTVNPWLQAGGTSLASPLMAGMIAQADQGRVLSGGQSFSSDQVLAALYSLESSKPSDFHDIIYGYNGFNAGPGYDLVTGLGTPNGSQLVPDLAHFGLSSGPTLTSVVVTPSLPSVDQGFTQQFTALGTFASGVSQNITSSVLWASATPTVATIDTAGLATTHAAGTSVITASLDGVTSPGVTLTSLPLVSIGVTPSNPSVDEGFTQQFTATGTFAGGSTHDLTSLVVWGSATSSVATIDASGLATTHAAGTSAITASLDGVTSPGVTLTSLPLVALAIAPNNPHVPVLLSVPFTVTGTYSDGSTHAIPSTSVVWASTKPTVAKINSGGLATAIALGTSVITASLYGVTSNSAAFTAVAPTFVVNTTADDLTYTVGKTNLREAILAANAYPGHSVTFDPTVFAAPRTITLSLGQLELSDTTGTETIQGPNKGVTVNGNNASRVFQVDAHVTASLSGLTVSGGGAFNGGGLYDLGNLTLTNCTVSGNSASNRGGGLYTPSSASGTTTLINCTVSNNSARGSGGGLGMRSQDMAVNLTNCTVSGNSSGFNGGGMQLFGTPTLTNCTVSGNTAAADGGGLSVDGSATLTNCTISSNSASVGGGVYSSFGSLAMRDCTVSGNSASVGGGVANDFGSLAMRNCTVSGNSAFYGGGVANSLGSLAMRNCTVSGNSASFAGAGVYTSGGGTTTLTDCTVSGNSGFAGAVCQTYGTTVLTGCTVSDNSAVRGGGILNESGMTKLTGCTVSGNFAVDNGGLENDFGTATLTNCTISGNSATQNGGGLENYFGTITLTNCTVSGNSAAIGGGIANEGALIVTSSNIVKNQATSAGGGISTTGGSATITNSVISANQVNATGAARGGGIDCENSVLSLNRCIVSANQAIGGAGATGSAGGDASGGGLYLLNSSATISYTAFLGNSAQGGAGGSEANGGSGYGGGIYVASGASASLTDCAIGLNVAMGGHGKYGGSDGEGIGGGVFTLGTFTFDAATFILLNFASTAGNNIGP